MPGVRIAWTMKAQASLPYMSKHVKKQECDTMPKSYKSLLWGTVIPVVDNLASLYWGEE